MSDAGQSATSFSPELTALVQLMERQVKDAEAREQRLAGMLQQALQTPAQPPSTNTKQISADRPMLSASANLSEFGSWEEAWNDYTTCQRLSSMSRETRVSAVRQAFNEDIKRFMREGVIAVKDTDDAPEIVAAVKAYIRRQRNPLLDRLDFYNCHQQPGESFDSFYTSLKELFHSCNFTDGSLCSTCMPKLCGSCPDVLASANHNILRDRIVVGLYDDSTRHKLLAEATLTLDSAIKLCRSEEAARQTGDTITLSASVNAIRKSSYKQRKSALDGRPTKLSKPDSPEAGRNSPSPAKCSNCGRFHGRSTCPATDRTCYGCNATGHFRNVCPKIKNSQKLAHLKLQRVERRDSFVTIGTDTSSDVDAIGLSHLRQLGGAISDLAPDHDIVLGANNQPLKSIGKVPAQLVLGSMCHATVLHVYQDIADPLLSCSSLVALGVLPADWPSQLPSQIFAVRTRSADQLKASLLEEFADVFDCSQLKPMNGPPMDIKLKPDASPTCVHRARPIPYAYREQVKKQLDGMVDEGIIEPVTEPTEWCHPIVIVDEKGTDEKRLTVDFKHLNDQVQRPAHAMHTPRDVVSSIDEAQFFSKLDARHGYWQVPLSEEAKSLTTFIRPWGRFRYLRNPQGLISAGDEFNRRTDSAFSHIARFRKVVDDCLVYDADLPAQYHHVRDVLLCARENGITMSPKKFVFGVPKVEFCGYLLSPDGWKVDDAKLDAVRDFPPPCNRTDLRSFMGLINQCAEFSPRLAELTLPLRSLLKPAAEFVWHSDHSAAFDAIKSEICSLCTLSYYQLGKDLRLETDASRLKGIGYVLWQKQEGLRCHRVGASRHHLGSSQVQVIPLRCAFQCRHRSSTFGANHQLLFAGPGGKSSSSPSNVEAAGFPVDCIVAQGFRKCFC